MNYLDLFSGVGGFAHAMNLAGVPITNHYHSEIEDYANRVYARHFPGATNLGDIRGIDGRALPPGEWIITGGFPCQDISVAKHGEGLTGKKSSLWGEMLRVIGEVQPAFAVIENVPGLRTKGLCRVVCGLAGIGYDAEWTTLRADAFGFPQRRERVWIAAYPSSHAGQQPGDDEEHQEGADVGNLVMPEPAVEGAGAWFDWRDTVRRVSNGSPFVCGKTDGVPRWLDRNRCLGNAIVPQVAAVILRRCYEVL